MDKETVDALEVIMERYFGPQDGADVTPPIDEREIAEIADIWMRIGGSAAHLFAAGAPGTWDNVAAECDSRILALLELTKGETQP